MNTDEFSEWLASLPKSERITAVNQIYSRLTVATREFFLPDGVKGKEQVVIHRLHGVNELHHTLSNWLNSYPKGDGSALPVDALSRQLVEIASQYHITSLLSWAVESVQSRNPR